MYNKIRCSAGFLLVTVLSVTLYACGNNSSPEKRMSTRVEELRQEILDSLNKHDTTMRDSLRMIRKDLEQMRKSGK